MHGFISLPYTSSYDNMIFCFTVFITEGPQERPLKYETTRPISGKQKSAINTTKVRRNSAPSQRTGAPSTVLKKELHNRGEPDYMDEVEKENHVENQSNHMTADDDGGEEEMISEKPPMSVKVKKSHPMDKFMNDLRMIDEMEQNFKKSAIDLQKRLGIETDGIVY